MKNDVFGVYRLFYYSMQKGYSMGSITLLIEMQPIAQDYNSLHIHHYKVHINHYLTYRKMILNHTNQL